jgi:hypothetical protein
MGFDSAAAAVYLRGANLECTRRAYSLIAKVREHAAQLLTGGEAYGRHYFACLLYWNLRYLKRPEVRRVKKLLALYSASEILAVFEKLMQSNPDE